MVPVACNANMMIDDELTAMCYLCVYVLQGMTRQAQSGLRAPCQCDVWFNPPSSLVCVPRLIPTVTDHHPALPLSLSALFTWVSRWNPAVQRKTAAVCGLSSRSMRCGVVATPAPFPHPLHVWMGGATASRRGSAYNASEADMDCCTPRVSLLKPLRHSAGGGGGPGEVLSPIKF